MPPEHVVPPEPGPAPDTGVVKVEIVQVPPVPGPKRDAGWWITTAGSLVVGALALVVAIIALLVQDNASRNAQAAVDSAVASDISLYPQARGSADFEIENLASSAIYSVWLQPAPARGLVSLSSLGPCKIMTVTLTTVSKPVIYFTDDHGHSWELPSGGHLEPAADPSAVIDLLAPGLQSSIVSGQLDVDPVTRQAPGCP